MRDVYKEAGMTSEDERRSWWDYIAGASGLSVAVGGLIYVLGLFSLWAPIARTQTPDTVAAWQATSLVPKTVVAGLGVKQLVAFPLFAGALIFIVTSSKPPLSSAHIDVKGGEDATGELLASHREFLVYLRTSGEYIEKYTPRYP
jgi:hypothetical protein